MKNVTYDTKKASDCKCNCGKEAVVFVGLADPDAEKYPKCRECADKWRVKLLMELFKDENKQR